MLDFGLAHLEPTVGSGGETATMTAPGTIAGTFLYMSPEQAEGKRVDARSDIFAFGSVAYEMLSGRQAFPGDSRLAILSGILHREPPPVPVRSRQAFRWNWRDWCTAVCRRIPRGACSRWRMSASCYKKMIRDAHHASRGFGPIARQAPPD